MTGSGKRKKSQLSREDRELWAKVTKTLTPLHPERASQPEADDFETLFEGEAPPDKRKKETATAMRAPSGPKPAAYTPPKPPPLHQLEHRYRKKVVRGVKPIDARIDLHGMTQHQAHERLRGFLYQAQASGHKIVLVITGKGGRGKDRDFRHDHWDDMGVLRRAVPQWLAMPDMRSVVIGYEEAHVTHGGSGALYVRIRRRR
ncbi:Smr/MutS family protein [Roseibium sp.]|uniref:Smr/MutS family protein n=1 Tax=Roseibium sp. TaxID=1936156 RepID=UPI003A97E85A